MSQILKYVGYTKPTLAMYVLHKLHGQMSQDHDFFFSLNADRDEASLTLLELSSIIEVHEFLLSFFCILN